MTGAAPPEAPDDGWVGAQIRYLEAAAVLRLLPTPVELVDLAELALRAIVSGALVPDKATVPPDENGLFASAMPARLRASDVAGGGAAADLLGVKWIAGGPGNRGAGRPALAALIVLDDPATGAPVAILDGDVITAARTAALSGAAVRLLGPSAGGEAPPLAVLVGAGAQGHAHAAMLGALLPGVELAVHDRHPERAAALAAAAALMPGVGAARVIADPAAALVRAAVVVTATSLGHRGAVLGPGDVHPEALVLPVDYGAYVTAGLVSAAATFAVDDAAAFEANRRSGRLAGWPDPSATLGELLLRRSAAQGAGGPQPSGGAARPRGLAVALHQGPGIADVIVADAVLRRAVAAGEGRLLPR